MIAAIVLIGLRRSREWAFAPILAFASAVVTGVVLMVATGAAPDDLARYVWPSLAGVLVAMLVMLVDGAALPFRSRRDGGAALAAVAIGSALAILAPLPRELDIGFTGIANIWNGYDPLQATARYRYEYGVAQASMPKGAKAAVTTDYPFLFDYKRNDVVNLDVLGAVSPAPGLPFGRTAEAMTRYLRDQGVQYVISTVPRTSICLYSPKAWRFNVVHHKPEKSMAPYFFDWFRWVRQRARQAPRSSTRGPGIALGVSTCAETVD